MISKIKNFESYFKFISYCVLFCGFLSLFASGSFEIISTSIFVFVIVLAWFLEDSRWQISERLGIGLIFVVIPLFYLDWKYQITGSATNEVIIAKLLARMILLLVAIKLLQKKSDKDWMFLYLMSFFEVLLAAGMSISPFYLASLLIYLLVIICAIIIFEIRKTSRLIRGNTNNKSSDSNSKNNLLNLNKAPISKLLLTAITMLVLIVALATPLFFTLPRVGGAGLGGNSKGMSSFTGFSDSVRLGAIGRLEQNDQIVMRARLNKADGESLRALRWRGVALDTFDNKTWSKSIIGYGEPYVKGERDFFLIDYPSSRENLTIQTIYLEPIDTPALFVLSAPVAIQGNFQILKKDSEDAISFSRNGFERLSYKVYSERNLPSVADLKSDNKNYSSETQRYLQLPEKFDERITRLARQITERANNRYDKAKALETYLQNNFGYTLELKAGGDEPLADFLFNVREGHCEYFATAMAVMLRTQGIATRVVNGFQQGEYNETADVYVVKQRDAHSWVEVYFPKENAWIPFDPTPFAGQISESNSTAILGKFNKYIEALETFWIQYFISYDNQEQRSLFRSVRNGFNEYQAKTSVWLNQFQNQVSDWWHEVRGDKGLETSAKAIGYGVTYLLGIVFGIIAIVWLFRKAIKSALLKKVLSWLRYKNETTIVEFYERMQRVLASKGFRREPHQTPLEFAFALNMPEAVRITEKYNRVRFGDKKLSKNEANEIENWLNDLAKNKE